MSNRNQNRMRLANYKSLMTVLFGFGILVAGGCESPSDSDGKVINSIVLPTDVVLNLACANVGINDEQCVLADPENPYVTTAIVEFDVNNPEATNKFDLFNAIPAGPTGAKARFYFWATALARRPTGENQFYTALALHELFDANSNVISQDELVRAQALKAYRSLLDNFFGSVTVFECCPGASPVGEPVAFAVPLNELAADALFRTDRTGYRRLVDGDPILVLEVLLDWGYAYQAAKPPNYDDGVVSVAIVSGFRLPPVRVMRHKLFVLVAGMMLMPTAVFAEAIPVQLRQTEDGWQLLRDGDPYLIRGAGGTHSLQQLADAGANSIRIWSGDDIDDLLDEAHGLGLTVTVGIWLGHERHGFDYHDKQQVAEQLEKARQIVLRYKDHPAVLLWGVGNEMEGYESGDDPLIWAAVNDVARMIKELDPAHPTMTVTAELGGGRIASVHQRTPAIDIHGINSYGGAPSVAERIRDGGGTKPYVITEFGPVGSWEMPTTEWGAPYEQTSTQKSDFYRLAYTKSVIEAEGLSLGSYAFHWGSKMEATATWFGMFLADGSRLGAVDVMTELWSGAPPKNLAPVVEPLVIEGEPQLDPAQELRVKASVSDPEDGPVTVRWVLRPESGDYLTGGDFRPNLPDIDGVVLEGDAEGAILIMPKEPGSYRLFLYAHDEAGGAATANIPLQVKGEARTYLPVSVYEDSFEAMPWAPSGWMGAVESLTLDGDYSENPYEGVASVKMRYEGKFSWVGVAWQNPANNWGEQDGGFDLRGAAALELWARGEYGGEKISIGVGLLGADTSYPDSGQTKMEGIVLSRDWQRYRLPLKGVDLSSIKTGFVITLAGRRTPVTIYLDSIRFTR